MEIPMAGILAEGRPGGQISRIRVSLNALTGFLLQLGDAEFEQARVLRTDLAEKRAQRSLTQGKLHERPRSSPGVALGSRGVRDHLDYCPPGPQAPRRLTSSSSQPSSTASSCK